MECGKIITPVRSKINSDLILHIHDSIFLVKQVAEDEFEAQPKRI